MGTRTRPEAAGNLRQLGESFEDEALIQLSYQVGDNGLSSKAGVQVGDEVVEVCGRKASFGEADNILRDNRLEISLVLSRFGFFFHTFSNL